jgi:hypothetical protein
MDRDDRNAIANLFERLREVERRNPRRDAQAEAFIREQIAAQPSAPYYLAQTVVVQQQALEAAQERIAGLEAQGGGGGRGFRPGYDDRAQPWGVGGGGFLAGAAQTAMGVAGGVLLGNMIAGALFGGNDAQAAEGADNADTGGDGGDFGGGGFDFGGE